jgi:flavocytochrome c
MIKPNSNPTVIIVVGAGLAGLSAAHAALSNGAAAVHVLERAAKAGGNSIKASSGINGAGTPAQALRGIVDETFYTDTVKSAGARFASNTTHVDRQALVSKLTAESASAVAFLTSLGVDLSVVAPLGGHSVPRTHRGAGKLPPGAAIVSTLLKTLQADERFSLRTGTTVRRLLTESSAVSGVEYESDGTLSTLNGRVVVAAGGFAGDATGLLAEYRPDLGGMPSTNEANPGSHMLLTDVGAVLLDMDSVQIHPTGFVDPASPYARLKFLAGEMLRGEGGILLRSGRRFVNELETRDNVSAAIMAGPPTEGGEHSEVRQWETTILLDPGAATAAATHLSFYEWKGLMRRVRVADLDESTLETIDMYARAVADGTPDAFGRADRGHWTLPPGEANRDAEVYVGTVTPIVHFTMGGVAFDTHARVLQPDGADTLVPIPGLFAAGEITGGIHGDNRLGGSSLLECVVFGRTAGARAAAGDE